MYIFNHYFSFSDSLSLIQNSFGPSGLPTNPNLKIDTFLSSFRVLLDSTELLANPVAECTQRPAVPVGTQETDATNTVIPVGTQVTDATNTVIPVGTQETNATNTDGPAGAWKNA